MSKHEMASGTMSLVGIGFVCLGSLAYSTMWFLMKLLPQNFSTILIIFHRSWIQIVLSFVSMVSQRKTPLGPRSLWKPLAVVGLLGALAKWTSSFSIQILPLGDGVTLQFLDAVFAGMFGATFLGEPWTVVSMMGAGVCIVGVLTIARPNWLFGHTDREGVDDDEKSSTGVYVLAVLIGLTGAAFLGALHVMVRFIGDRVAGLTVVLWISMASVIISVPGLKLSRNSWDLLTWVGWTDFGLLMACGATGFLGQLFVTMGLQREKVVIATLATNTEVVFAYLFELILHESVNPWSILGTILILGNTVALSLANVWEEAREEKLPRHVELVRMEDE
ncbi:unnamed protein product [Discosporangium mesarthrocarpum]